MKVKFKKEKIQKWWKEHGEDAKVVLIVTGSMTVFGGICALVGYVSGKFPHGPLWSECCEQMWKYLPEDVPYDIYKTEVPELRHPLLWMGSIEDINTVISNLHDMTAGD